jgi:hypothetical protein
VAETFADMLTGGHRNSLGRTGEVVDAVLADRSRLDELFATLSHPDDVVRMRAGDALEKVCRERPQWLRPYLERLLTEVGRTEQPSLQWHTAQILERLRGDLDAGLSERAVDLLRGYLLGSRDWIVLNVTMDVLGRWALADAALAAWLEPQLERLQGDPRASVSKRASSWHARLAGHAR